MGECSRNCGCHSEPSRRDLLKIGVSAAGVLAAGGIAGAAPGDIPPAGRVPPPTEWFAQLARPGQPIVYSGDQLKNLIFPLGGIGTGTLWLHGSGRLVNWQIFNNIQKATHVDDTFFAVRVEEEGKPAQIRALQQTPVGPFPGIPNLRFRGRYPVATLHYSEDTLPVELELEAFNPLIPLDEKNSAIPCAIVTIRARNRTDRKLRVSFLASLQNAVGHAGSGASTGNAHPTYGGNVNRLVEQGRVTAVSMGAEPGKPAELRPAMDVFTDHADLPYLNDPPVSGLVITSPGLERVRASARPVYWITRGDLRQFGASLLKQVAVDVREHGAVLLLSGLDNPLARPVRSTVSGKVSRRETVFETFDRENFGRWNTEGDAFKRPQSGTAPGQNPVSGFAGSGLVNTYDPGDGPQGTLTSPTFIIKERYISLLVGGGNYAKSCAVNLLIDGKPVRSATGRNTEQLERIEWDVTDLADREARLQIVDRESGGWGHVLVDDIRFSNLPVDAITEEDARAWNELLQRAGEGAPMSPVGFGEGRVLIVPVELGNGRPGVDRLVQRDRALQMLAGLVGAQYQSAVGRPPGSPSSGTMCLATADANATVRLGWTDRADLFQILSANGRLDAPTSGGELPVMAGPSGPGETVNAAVCVEAEVPGATAAQATFAITWHFPHQYYPQNVWSASGKNALLVGNMYTNWYRDAVGVAMPLFADLERLRRETFAFVDAMFDTTLPQYLVDAAAANISILRSPTCFWTREGTFYGFEGCGTGGRGCCPMNCNHVWNYEQTLAKLWPSVERNMRATELKFHQRDDGGVHHRVEVPRDDPQKRHIPVADGQCGAVLKAYREHLQSSDRRFLDETWPMIRKAMDFAISEWDADMDGIMEKPQFNTYDRVIYGHNTFVSSLYLAALRAAEEMARLVKDAPAAERYRKLFENGSRRMAETLYDGEYYIQKADNLNLGYGTGCFSDQVVGQWWARVLNLGDILPNDQVRSALKAVFRHNMLWTQEGFAGTQRFLEFADGTDKGLLIASWPKGGRPQDPILYRDEIWTGVEYQVAAHMIYEGQVDSGLAIVRAARERYDGRKKSPWNEIECGDYYVRAMSSWSLLLAAQGYVYDGPRRMLGFDPRLTPDDHRSFFTTAEAWGSFSQKRAERRQTDTLTFIGGRMDIRELQFALPAGATTATGTAHLGDRELVAAVRLDQGAAILELHAPVTAQAGETLTVTLEWT